MVVVSVSFTSCSSDEPGQNSPNTQDEIQVNQNVKVLSYENFSTPTDVTVNDNERTSISVSRSYLDSQNMSLTAGDVVCVWTAIDQEPFVRIIDQVSSDGGKTTFTSHAGSLADVIKDGTIDFSCEAYVNPNADTEEARYMSDSRTYHPAVVIMSDDNSKISEYATAEELVARGDYSKNFIIYSNNIAVNKKYTAADGKIVYGIDNGYVKPSLNLNFFVNISAFKIKQFHAYANGSIDTSLPLYVTSNASKTWSTNQTLYKFNKLTYVFKIGVVPVTLTIDAKILLEASATATNAFSATMPVNYKANFSIGPNYVAENGWSLYKSFSQTRGGALKKLNISNKATLDAQAAVFADVAMTIYGCAGPTLKVGPKVTTNNVVTAGYNNSSTASFNVNSKGNLAIVGTAGAKLSLLGYNLKEWSKDFTLYQTQLWSLNKSFSKGITNL